ncbi:hypothetical protein NEUTE1DRAFT_95933 [Neurospora tetrasperma FGSC 2508]|uniref:Uncharacterized protein n=1 Tax=Neurospora tetrasperma (strain FGSC 2508 / ATCC MYA-4615 / P0657) TaxID=510951 RepID=F8MVK6_NEUT8|nr:uncharacterized protein NEUTE1DRAFT_95933 [Neurospora tetrasperma FGSC 2508]EGO53958.1 hypothetical protein NEUTE1DRAFT_95933 [Neurospora tetrasperma FGSC 2508]EGZ68624.1 hypothetical protein NEUTE2DRAFT_122675 [Neurospora tetrasperma FGSC 2509]
MVIWKDANHQDQQTSDLRIDLLVDTAKREAVFALHGFFYTKNGGHKAYLSLLVYPEKVESIEFERARFVPDSIMNNIPDDSTVSLRFTMTQPPNLMVPKDRRVEPKPRYQAVVDTIASLGSVNRFTIYLSDLTPEIQQELALLPSVFSSVRPFGRLQADEKWAPPSSLYQYTFAQVIDLTSAAPVSNGDSTKEFEELGNPVEAGAAVPPPYSPGDSQRSIQSIGPSSKKRRASEPLLAHTTEKHGDSDSSILGYGTPGKGPQPPYTRSDSLASPAHFSTPSDRKRQRTAELLSPVTNADIVSALRQVLTYNTSLSNRISQLETRLDHCSSRLDSLITEFVAATDRTRTPCRYDTEEAEHVFSQIDQRIEDGIHDIRHELEDTIKVEAEERVTEEVRLQHEELRDKVEADWTEDVRQGIAEQIASEVEEKTTREVLKGIAEVLMGAYQASQDGISSLFPGNSRFGATAALPGEAALRAAVEDIQSKHKDELTGEEMIGVLDLLEENPLSAVKYNACGEETRRVYVMKWKADVSGRGIFKSTWYKR